MQSFPPVWIFTPTLDAYVGFFMIDGIQISIVNSFMVAIANTLIVIAISAPAAYSMARYNTGGESLLMYILSVRFIPYMAIVPALFIQWDNVGLLNTRTVLVLTYLIINVPFAVWLIRIGFKEIPQSLFDASKMDGATEVEMFFYVAIPMIKPVLFAAAIISFIFAWNEYVFALVFTRGLTTTAPVKIASLVTFREIMWNQIMAGAMVLIVPIIGLVYHSRDSIIRGLTFGTAE